MAITLTDFLKLRIGDDLTADAVFNLERIDDLGSTFSLTNTNDLNIRSQQDINVQPRDPSIGGTGSGGTINLGSSDQPLTALNIFATAINLSGSIDLSDVASGGDKDLTLQYKSDITGAVDTTADRTLGFDVEGADRTVTLAGNLSILVGNVTLTSSNPSSVTLPSSGTLSTLAGSETLTNKNIDSDTNTITNIINADVKSGAAIAGTKIDPDFGIQAITTSGESRYEEASAGGNFVGFKAAVNLSGNQIWTLPTADGSPNQIIQTNGSGVLSFATGSTTSLSEDNIRIGNASNIQAEVDTTSVGDIEADSTTGLTIKAGIIDNANIDASAAIALSKLAALTASRATETNGSGVITASTITSTELGRLTGVSSNIQTQIDTKITESVAAIVDADVNASAAITLSKLAALTASRAVVSNGSGVLSVSATTSTEIGFVSGLTSAVQTQINTKKNGAAVKATWSTADGTTKAITHSLGTRDITVTIYDSITFATVFPDTEVRTDVNTLTLTTSIAPPNDFIVLIETVVP